MKKQPFRFHVVLLSVLFTAAVFLPFELTAQEEDGEVRDRLEDLEQR